MTFRLRRFFLCILLIFAFISCVLAGAETSAKFSIVRDKLQIDYQCSGVDWERTVFIALKTGTELGSAVVPFAESFEGSPVFLPFQANKLYLLQMGTDTLKVFKREWQDWKWSEHRAAGEEVDVEVGAFDCRIRFPLRALTSKMHLVLYSKDFTQNKRWGRLFGAQDLSLTPGEGDKYIPHYLEVDLGAKGAPIVKSRRRLGYESTRPRIYQLFVRLFGNSNETRQPNGTLAINGVGKFGDINDAALVSLQQLGFSHVWLTG